MLMIDDVIYGTAPQDPPLGGLLLFESTLREQLAAKILQAIEANNLDTADFLQGVRAGHMAARVRLLFAWAVLAVATVLAVRRPTSTRKWALAGVFVLAFWASVSYARHTKRASMIAADPGQVLALEDRLGLTPVIDS